VWPLEEAQRTGKAPRPNVARVWVRKLVEGQWTEFSEEARWDEYYPGEGFVGNMYRKFPTVMLAKCAEARAIRRGWPAEIGPLRIAEELLQEEAPATGTGGREAAEMPAAGAGLAQADVSEGSTVQEVPSDTIEAQEGAQTKAGYQLPSVEGDHLELLLTLDGIRGKDLKQQAMYIWHAIFTSVETSYAQADTELPTGDALMEETVRHLRHFSTREDGGISLKNWEHVCQKVDEGSKAITVCYGRLKKWVAQQLEGGTSEAPAMEPKEPGTEAPQGDAQAPQEAPEAAAPAAPAFELEQESAGVLAGQKEWAAKAMEDAGLQEAAVKVATCFVVKMPKWTEAGWALVREKWAAIAEEAKLRQYDEKDFEQGQGWTVEQARDAISTACESTGTDYQAFLGGMVEYFGLQDRRSLNRAYCIAGVRMMNRIVELQQVKKAE
jgi:hypothetical protein